MYKYSIVIGITFLKNQQMLLVFFKKSKTINIGNDIIYYKKETKNQCIFTK